MDGSLGIRDPQGRAGQGGAAAAVEWISRALDRRLAATAAAFRTSARAEVRAGADLTRFLSLISLCSRYVPASALEASSDELADAAARVEGWWPERWSLRDLARVELVLSRPDLDDASGPAALEEAFQTADLGEAVAMYRSLALWPRPERLARRGAEGARNNVRAIFEAAVCDSAFAVRCFDDVAWRQCVIKALFVEAPLWRVHGLDGRLDAEIARMALDLAEERRSAGRHIAPQLWMCLGAHGGERGLRALLAQLDTPGAVGRGAAALALGRLAPALRVQVDFDARIARELDPAVRDALGRARGGVVPSNAFRPFDGPVPKVT